MNLESLERLFSKWCAWRLGPMRNGKFSKIPFDPVKGVAARVNAPETFGTYQQAQAALAGGSYEGVGLLLASAIPDADGNAVICIDIDACIDDEGNPAAIAEQAFALFKGYAEISQSKSGLHFFILGKLPVWCSREKVTHEGKSVEVYSSAASTRYICATGNEVREGVSVIEEQAALETFLRQFGFDAAAQSVTGVGVQAPGISAVAVTDSDGVTHDDADIIALMLRSKKRAKISRLLAGDLKDYDGDHSKADLGLCSEIAYYTKDPDQVASIFEQSELSKRDKWKKRADYREGTIDKAIAGATGDYFEQGKAVGATKSAAGSALAQYGDKLQGGAADLEAIKRGQLASTIENGIQVLLRDFRTQGVCGYNLFAGAPYVLRPLQDVFGPAALSPVGEFLEADGTAVRAWFGREYRMRFSKDDMLDIICAWSKHVKFNPVTDALDKAHAQWDGLKRLDGWLHTYLGVDPTIAPEYHRVIGRAFLIGTVARAYSPGCKFDYMLVLEGLQGAGKSRTARVIGQTLCLDAYTETVPVLTASTKEAAIHIRGKHVAEMQELAGLRKADLNAVKEFVSTTEDRLRPPFARSAVDWKRTCVFIGTTNDKEYLNDPTGARRFWGCEVGKAGKLDVDRLRADMLQLYGEAVVAYRAGEVFNLEKKSVDFLRQSVAQQSERQIGDAWDDNIASFKTRTFTEFKYLENRYALGELYEAVFPTARIEVSAQDFDKVTQMRFATRLQFAGFEKFKTGGRSVWRLSAVTAEQIKNELVSVCPDLSGPPVLGKLKASVLRSKSAGVQIH